MKNLIFQNVSLEELTEATAEKVLNKLENRLPKHEKPDRYLTRKEVAVKLQISLVTLNEYSKKGITPSYRLGSSIRYKESEIDAIINDGLRFTVKNNRRA